MWVTLPDDTAWNPAAPCRADALFRAPGVAGNVIGPVGLICANLASTAALAAFLKWEGAHDAFSPTRIANQQE